MTVKLPKKRQFDAFVILALAVLFVAAIYVIVRDNQRALTAAVFERNAGHYVSHLQKQIDRSVEVVESISSFFDASVQVERHEFRAFTAAPLSRHKDIQALEWIPMVAADERRTFEERARIDGIEGFQFTERRSQGVMQRASPRERYFPVYFMEPMSGNEAALGFDLGSDPTRLHSIRDSMVTGELTTSGRINLVQGTGDHLAFLILRPVYDRDLSSVRTAEAGLKGFALGVFRIEDLVTDAQKSMDIEGVGFFLFDDSAPSDQRYLYHFAAYENPVTAVTPEEPPEEILAGLHHWTELHVPGRRWTLLFYPARGHYAEIGGRSALIVLAGLLFTGLLAGLLWTTARHTQKVEGLLTDLSRSNLDLEREMEQRRLIEFNLQASLEEKEVLLKEIHHRVKNNLQMVSGLLNLQAHHIDSPRAKRVYRESENRVMSMALIHENLYRSRDLSQVNVVDYFRNLSRNIASSYEQERGEVRVLFDIEKISLPIDTVIPAGLIVNEMLTNAYQHAFADGARGEITLGFRRDGNDQFILTVADDGVGMPEGRELTSFSPRD